MNNQQYLEKEYADFKDEMLKIGNEIVARVSKLSFENYQRFKVDALKVLPASFIGLMISLNS